MSVELTDHIIDNWPELRDAPFVVALIVSRYDRGSRGDGCRASIPTIAKDARRDRRTTQRAINYLIDLGVIRAVTARGPGRGRITTYRVVIEKKGGATPPFPEKKRRHHVSEKAAPRTVKGGAIPPERYIRRTVGQGVHPKQGEGEERSERDPENDVKVTKEGAALGGLIKKRSLPRVDFSKPANSRAWARQQMSPKFISPELMFAAEDVTHPEHARAVALAQAAAAKAEVTWHPPTAPPRNGAAAELPAAANNSPRRA